MKKLMMKMIIITSNRIKSTLQKRGCKVYVISFLSSVVLLKLHGCVVSHMQVLATTLLSVHNINCIILS